MTILFVSVTTVPPPSVPKRAHPPHKENSIQVVDFMAQRDGQIIPSLDFDCIAIKVLRCPHQHKDTCEKYSDG